jgi:outer membrane receptor for ferrienterochelin and colicins
LKLPLAGELDPRPQFSSLFTIYNVALVHKRNENLEVFLSIKNLLNWTPSRNLPFLISISHDPFDKLVQTDNEGNTIVTNENPCGLTFDPSYVYYSNQWIRCIVGLKFKF